MASSLILNKRISTTLAKAKALRKYVEPLMTKAKNDTTHSRRVVFSYLNNKESVKTLFDEVAEKIASRPGGYTRIIKTGTRLGDNAEMCIMELVDYNELLLKDTKPAKSKRRSRRGGKSKKATETVAKAPATVETTEEIVEETGDQVEAVSEEVVEAASDEVVSTAEDAVTEEAVETTEKPLDQEEAAGAAETDSAEATETVETPEDVIEAESIEATEATDTETETLPEEATKEEPSGESTEEPKSEAGEKDDASDDDKEK